MYCIGKLCHENLSIGNWLSLQDKEMFMFQYIVFSFLAQSSKISYHGHLWSPVYPTAPDVDSKCQYFYYELPCGTLSFICYLFLCCRVVGIYLQILTRILYKDITRFVIIFGIFLLTYTGSLFLALRSEPINGLEHNSTSDPADFTELSIGHFTS